MDKIWTCFKDDRLRVYDHVGYHKFIESLPRGNYEMIIRKPKSKRSKAQRNYYRGVIIPAWQRIFNSLEGWVDEDETNERLKEMFNAGFHTINGVEHRYGKSIENESVANVELIYEKMRVSALQDFGAVIPLPNEVDYE